MKQWKNPEVVDLKISLTAGFYGGIVNGKKQPNHSFHTPSPTPTILPTPTVNPSEILNGDDFIEDENW